MSSYIQKLCSVFMSCAFLVGPFALLVRLPVEAAQAFDIESLYSDPDTYNLDPTSTTEVSNFDVSSNGRYVVFSSVASNLVSNDTTSDFSAHLYKTTNPHFQNSSPMTLSDQLTDSRVSNDSDHRITFTTTSNWSANQLLQLDFADEFDFSAITITDIDVADDGVDLSLDNTCSNSTDLSYSLDTTTNLISLVNCSETNVASGSVITIEIGTNSGGSNQVGNPDSSSGYLLSAHLNRGSISTIIAIIDGISITTDIDPVFTLTVVGVAANTSPLTNFGNACETAYGTDKTSVTTTATAVNFGQLSANTTKCAAHEILVESNAPNGFSISMYQSDDMTSPTGDKIKPFNKQNMGAAKTYAQPTAVNGNTDTYGHFGIQSSDTTLGVGDFFENNTKFTNLDSSISQARQILYHDKPTGNGEIEKGRAHVGYVMEVSPLQPAGIYTNTITIVGNPIF